MDIDILFWLVFLTSWFIYLLPQTLAKKVLMVISPVLALALGAAASDILYVFAGFILSLSHARFFMRRYGAKRTRRVLRRTWILLLIIGLAISGLRWLAVARTDWLLSAVALVWIAASARALTATAIRSLRFRYRERSHSKLPPKNLPTVTLAIPARNETHVLTDCLRSAVSSDYPKLEIIVLDDCSQDSTPQIIKSFAHDGVRFVSGDTPAVGWIGKNQAYQTLLEQASGEIIVFAGVDVRWQQDSVSRMVAAIRDNNANMVSIMPFRSHFDLWPAVSRTLRYCWQLAFARLPVMNSVWAADRQWLQSVGGIKPFKHAILPERQFATLADRDGAYRFILSNTKLGISSRKHASSQFETALRTLYPQSMKDPLLAVLASAIWIIATGLWIGSWFLNAPIFTAGAAALLISYMLSEINLQPNGWLVSGFMLPFAMLSQGVLTIASMTGYEFGRIEWKGRNICLPVMKQPARDETYFPKSRR